MAQKTEDGIQSELQKTMTNFAKQLGNSGKVKPVKNERILDKYLSQKIQSFMVAGSDTDQNSFMQNTMLSDEIMNESLDKIKVEGSNA